MNDSQPRIVEYSGKSFDDPDYDHLLAQFSYRHPQEMVRWRALEIEAFDVRMKKFPFPDQALQSFVLDFLETRLADERGGLGPYAALKVMRGRILRALIDDISVINPAPGKVLLTDPRTCNDGEIKSIAEAFSYAQPKLWRDWQRIEANNNFDDDPLREISLRFHNFLREVCWAQSSLPCIQTFMDVRSLIFHPTPQRRSMLQADD